MNEENLLFKCNATHSIEDYFKYSNEAYKIISKKFITIFKILMSFWVIITFVYFIWDYMYNEDAFLIEAIGYLLSSKLLVTIYILIALLIWKPVEISNWFIVNIRRFKRRSIKKPSSSYISFYETFYEVLSFDKSTKSYYLARINYSDITKFFTSNNLYVFCNTSKELKSAAFIRKDSFIEGTERDFIKFIESNISIE